MDADPMAGTTRETLAAVERLNEAVNRHDADALVAAMTDDCVFESTEPPDGRRYQGEAIAAAFRELFASAPRRRFVTEDIVAAGDRAVVLWRHEWVGTDGTAGHVRGVDVFRVRDGKVAEKLSYVKG
jgi:ketosteroid isomerase-like protein